MSQGRTLISTLSFRVIWENIKTRQGNESGVPNVRGVFKKRIDIERLKSPEDTTLEVCSVFSVEGFSLVLPSRDCCRFLCNCDLGKYKSGSQLWHLGRTAVEEAGGR